MHEAKEYVKDYAELIEYLSGKFDKIDERFDKLESRMGGFENRIGSLEAKVDELPTKAYIDNKIANYWGGSQTQLVAHAHKVNRLTEILKKNQVITEDQFQELGQYKTSAI